MFSLILLGYCCSEVLSVNRAREYLSVCLSILTFTSIFPYLSILKILSSHLYLQFQPNITKFILLFSSVCVFVTPFSNSEKPGSHFIRLVAVYVTLLPLLLQSPVRLFCLHYTDSDIPSWFAIIHQHIPFTPSHGHPPQLPWASTI